MFARPLHSLYNKLTCFSGQKSPLSIDTENKGPCIAYFCSSVKHRPTGCYILFAAPFTAPCAAVINKGAPLLGVRFLTWHGGEIIGIEFQLSSDT